MTRLVPRLPASAAFRAGSLRLGTTFQRDAGSASSRSVAEHRGRHARIPADLARWSVVEFDEPGRPELGDRAGMPTHGGPSDRKVIAVFIAQPSQIQNKRCR